VRKASAFMLNKQHIGFEEFKL